MIAEGLDKEISELKQFITDLKADRAAQKEKEQRESWTKYTSISLVFIAVLAAVASQWAGKYSSRVLVELNDSTFEQAQAADRWGQYQAKSIKQNIYEALHEVQFRGAGTAGVPADLEAFLKTKMAKYESDKTNIMAEAQHLEKLRDEARSAAAVASKHGAGMAMAISIFQIAIALASICLVTKKKPLWYLSILLSIAAAIQMAFVWMR